MYRLILSFLIMMPLTVSAASLPIDTLQLPAGFSVTVFAKVPGARQIVRGDKGTIFVGTLSDKVYAITPNASGSQGERVRVIAKRLNKPNGVAFRHGALYVGEINRILRYEAIETHLDKLVKPVVVYDKLPNKTHHGWKYLAFGPDDWLYFNIGAPCNVCLQADQRFATIMRMPASGGQPQVYAHGVRDSVGFAWDPQTRQLWFTDNGRDWLGDNLPPDELNHASRQGQHFGFPFLYGNNQPDPKFGRLAPKITFTPPIQLLGPHVAALGMIFYSGKMFPKKYQQQIFIAEHGSWNRSNKIGYRLSLVEHDDNKVLSYKPFATGWLQGEEVWGRPVDVLQMPDGALLVSDDYAGVIYRISYHA